MRRLRRSFPFVLALALWLGAGTIASAAMTIDMTNKVSMADSGDPGTASGCPACDDMGDSSNTADCLPNCSLSHGVTGPTMAARQDAKSATFAPRGSSIPRGHISGFDPSPPKTLHS